MEQNSVKEKPNVTIEMATEALSQKDLIDLCDVTAAAIEGGGGFGWLKLPPRDLLERFWNGVVLIPDRVLFLVRLDGVIAGSAQLVKPPRNNEAQSHAATLLSAFIAPWARHHDLGKTLINAVIDSARESGFKVLNLDVRDSQKAAMSLYEHLGFKLWGSNPHYAYVDGSYVTGHYYTYSLIDEDS